MNTESLFALAEVAVAFAGFSSIVVGLRLGTTPSWPEIDTYRVRYLLMISIGVVFGALVPVGVEAFGPAESTLWRISAALILIYVTLGYASVQKIPANVLDVLMSFPGARLTRAAVFILPAISGTLFLLVLSGLTSWYFGLYYFGLLLLLAAAAVQFVRAILARG